MDLGEWSGSPEHDRIPPLGHRVVSSSGQDFPSVSVVKAPCAEGILHQQVVVGRDDARELRQPWCQPLSRPCHAGPTPLPGIIDPQNMPPRSPSMELVMHKRDRQPMGDVPHHGFPYFSRLIHGPPHKLLGVSARMPCVPGTLGLDDRLKLPPVPRAEGLNREIEEIRGQGQVRRPFGETRAKQHGPLDGVGLGRIPHPYFTISMSFP